MATLARIVGGLRALWTVWRTRRARRQAEERAMYQATVDALAAGLRMDASTLNAKRTLSKALATQKRKRFTIVSKRVH
jgi:Flp pilus assembly protein TadB